MTGPFFLRETKKDRIREETVFFEPVVNGDQNLPNPFPKSSP